MSPKAYEAETAGVIVRVRPQFLPDQSSADHRRWVWAYQVEIVNASAETLTLRERHWIITDGLGRVEEVRGEGVVGEQPTLAPGEGFVYVSGCPLETPSGSMAGSYRMERSDGSSLTVKIPAFSLDLPEKRVLN